MLYLPPPRNGLYTMSDTSRIANTLGTSVTPGSGTKGSWAEVIASTSQEVSWIEIHINSNNSSGASRNTLLDVGIGAAGSEVVVIPDLIGGNAWSYAADGIFYRFPLMIPAGTRIAVRAAGSVTTAFNVLVNLLTHRAFDQVCGKVSAVGIASATQGTGITPGTASFSAWVSLGTTPHNAFWVQLGVQVNSADTSHNTGATNTELAFGDATTKIPLISHNPLFTSGSETHSLIASGIEGYRYIPSGSTLYARAQTSANADPVNVAAYVGG